MQFPFHHPGFKYANNAWWKVQIMHNHSEYSDKMHVQCTVFLPWNVNIISLAVISYCYLFVLVMILVWYNQIHQLITAAVLSLFWRCFQIVILMHFPQWIGILFAVFSPVTDHTNLTDAVRLCIVKM